LLIKTYFPEASPFPPGGTLGNYLDVLKEGEQIDINGRSLVHTNRGAKLTLFYLQDLLEILHILGRETLRLKEKSITSTRSTSLLVDQELPLIGNSFMQF